MRRGLTRFDECWNATHLHKHTHKHTSTHKHKHTHTHTTHTHTCTHTHTHTSANAQPYIISIMKLRMLCVSFLSLSFLSLSFLSLSLLYPLSLSQPSRHSFAHIGVCYSFTSSRSTERKKGANNANTEPPNANNQQRWWEPVVNNAEALEHSRNICVSYVYCWCFFFSVC